VLVGLAPAKLGGMRGTIVCDFKHGRWGVRLFKEHRGTTVATFMFKSENLVYNTDDNSYDDGGSADTNTTGGSDGTNTPGTETPAPCDGGDGAMQRDDTSYDDGGSADTNPTDEMAMSAFASSQPEVFSQADDVWCDVANLAEVERREDENWRRWATVHSRNTLAPDLSRDASGWRTTPTVTASSTATRSTLSARPAASSTVISKPSPARPTWAMRSAEASAALSARHSAAHPAALTAAFSARPAASSDSSQENDDKSTSPMPSDFDKECVISSATRDGILMQFSKWNRKCEARRQIYVEDDETYIAMMVTTEAPQGGREDLSLAMVGDRDARHSEAIPDESTGQDDDDAPH
jgi:hypothetical protein